MRWSRVPACLAIALLGCGGGGGQGSSDATVDGLADAADDHPADTDAGDAAPHGPFAPFACDLTSCTPPGEVCCRQLIGAEDPILARSCVAAGTCASPYETVACRGAENCATGQVCCRTAPTPGSIVAACAATCGAGALQLCASSAECPKGQQCLTDPVGWKICDTPCIDGENVGLQPGPASSSTLWLAYEYTAAASFTLASIKLFTNGRAAFDAGAASVALLDAVPTDASAYQPGTVRAIGTLAPTNAYQWNTATMSPPVSVTKGHVYFIAQLMENPSTAQGGVTTVEYRSPSLGGPWSGPYSSSLLAQTCQ